METTIMGMCAVRGSRFNCTRTSQPFFGFITISRVMALGWSWAARSTAFCGSSQSDTSYRSEEHTSELQSPYDLVCRLLLGKKKRKRDENRDLLALIYGWATLVCACLC